MSRDNIVYAVFGLILGLVIGAFLLGPRLARSKLAGSDAPPAEESSAKNSPETPSAGTQPAAGGSSDAPSATGMPAGGMEGVKQQLDSLEQRIAKDPKDTQALSQLANMYMDVGKFPQAIGFYEQALRVHDDTNIRTDLGICYKQAGQLDKAYGEFKRVADESPGQWQPIYNLAVVLGEMRRFAEARAQLAKLEQLRPGDPDVKKLGQALATAK